MAKKNEPYEVIVVRTGYSDKKVAKYVAQGWEVVAERGGQLGTGKQTTMRRPNPKFKG